MTYKYGYDYFKAPKGVTVHNELNLKIGDWFCVDRRDEGRGIHMYEKTSPTGSLRLLSMGSCWSMQEVGKYFIPEIWKHNGWGENDFLEIYRM